MAEDALEPLVTQCPHCKTRFRVTQAQLNVADGRVRCGACLAVFTGTECLVRASEPPAVPENADAALDALLDELRKDAPAQEPDEEPDEFPASDAAPDDVTPAVDGATVPEDDEPAAAATAAADVVQEATAEWDAEPEAAEPARPPDDDECEQATSYGVDVDAADHVEAPPQTVAVPVRTPVDVAPRATETPGSARRGDSAGPRERALRRSLDLGIDPEELVALPRRRRRRWLIWPMLLLCVAALAAQVLYLQFDVWAKDPQLRPIYAWLCPRLGCRLPELRALDKLVSKNLVVRADPNVPGALQVDALIINEAAFPQPFPVIELRFSSMGGNLITGRRFRPDEYLAGELQGATLIQPMTPVHIALEIDDPGQDAVNYVMVFR